MGHHFMTTIYVCPTCRDWRYLELYPDKNGMISYCRRCEEGCVKPLVQALEAQMDEQRFPKPKDAGSNPA